MKKVIYTILVSASLLAVNAFAGQHVWVDAKKMAKDAAEDKCKGKGYGWAEKRSNNYTKWECKGKGEVTPERPPGMEGYSWDSCNDHAKTPAHDRYCAGLSSQT